VEEEEASAAPAKRNGPEGENSKETGTIDLEEYEENHPDEPALTNAQHPKEAGGDNEGVEDGDGEGTPQKRKGDPELEAELVAKRQRQEGKSGEEN